MEIILLGQADVLITSLTRPSAADAATAAAFMFMKILKSKELSSKNRKMPSHHLQGSIISVIRLER